MAKTLQELLAERALSPPRACRHAWVSIDPGIEQAKTVAVQVLPFDDPNEPTLRIAAGRSYGMTEAQIALLVKASAPDLGCRMVVEDLPLHDAWLPFLRAEAAFLQANPNLTPNGEGVLSWIRYEMMLLCPENVRKEAWALERVIPVLEQLRVTCSLSAVRTVREPDPVPPYVRQAAQEIARKLIAGHFDYQEKQLVGRGYGIVPVVVIQDFAKSQAG